MNKASELAKAMEDLRAQTSFMLEHKVIAQVTDSGALSFYSTIGVMNLKQVLAFRDWLTETFDEVPK